MLIESRGGERVANMADWEKSVTKKDWKPYRSAHALAGFVLNEEGAEKIRRVVSAVVKEPVCFDLAMLELRIAFDKFRSPRHHDLGIYGKTGNGKTVFVGVEAKVDEEFGKHVKAEFKNSSPTAKQRIEGLWKRHAFKSKIEESKIRYQLLYSTVGTVDAGADISVFIVMVFQTCRYDGKKGKRNYCDYMHFMRETGARRLDFPDDKFDVHHLNLNGKSLFCVYQNGVD